MARYTKEENETLKKRLKVFQRDRKKEVKQLTNARLLLFRKKEAEFKKEKKEAIKQSKEDISKNFDTLLRHHVMQNNMLKNQLEEQQKFINSIQEVKQ